MLYSLLTTTTLLAAAALASPIRPRQASCGTGVHIIHARGSTQTPAEDTTLPVVARIKAGIPDSTSEAVDYPAVIIADDGIYTTSVAEGIDDTIAKIEAYVDACGEGSRIVLLGYSQGGNVMTSALAGGIVRPIPLGMMYRQYITAVAVFGDPTHRAGQSYSAGNADGSGIFRRVFPSTTLLSSYTVRSYCLEDDLFCDGEDSLDAHSTEMETYGPEAADWIIGLAGQ